MAEERRLNAKRQQWPFAFFNAMLFTKQLGVKYDVCALTSRTEIKATHLCFWDMFSGQFKLRFVGGKT